MSNVAGTISGFARRRVWVAYGIFAFAFALAACGDDEIRRDVDAASTNVGSDSRDLTDAVERSDVLDSSETDDPTDTPESTDASEVAAPDIEFRLTWQNSAVDLDLSVTLPSGEVISFHNYTSTRPGGGTLQSDIVVGSLGGEERLVVDDEAVGEYTAVVNYYEGSDSVEFELAVYRGGVFVDKVSGSFAASDEGADSEALNLSVAEE